jgi:hypothetical protein
LQKWTKQGICPVPCPGITGHGLKQGETPSIKISPKMADFCGFCNDFVTVPAGKVVRPGGVESNQNRDSNLVPHEDSNSLFRTLDEWNVILEGLQNPSTRKAADNLPRAKASARPSPPVRRRHKRMGGKA